MKRHRNVLKDFMPKYGEYPRILNDARSIHVEERHNFIPTYMDGMAVNMLEYHVKCAENYGQAEGCIEAQKARNSIDSIRGNVNQLVYGMHRDGDDGYPTLMVITDDLNSSDPAISKSKIPGMDFKIKPKCFELGLTGRILEDNSGERYNDSLSIELDLFDAFDFAKDIRPARILSENSDGKLHIIYEDGKIIDDTEYKTKRKKVRYVMSEDQKGHWSCETEVLPTSGLKVVDSDFYERMKKYADETILFGHNYKDIHEFLAYVTLIDEHLIWKICKDRSDPNTALVDSEPYYGLYLGKHQRHENKGRLHFMPHKAHLYSDAVTINFDHRTGIQSLMNLGDTVRDIWASSIKHKHEDRRVYGWDIIYDATRGITPENPIWVRNNKDYEKYCVLK